jgi:hypothetical protein
MGRHGKLRSFSTRDWTLHDKFHEATTCGSPIHRRDDARARTRARPSHGKRARSNHAMEDEGPGNAQRRGAIRRSVSTGWAPKGRRQLRKDGGSRRSDANGPPSSREPRGRISRTVRTHSLPSRLITHRTESGYFANVTAAKHRRG